MTSQKKNLAPAATGNEDKSFRKDSTTAYLFKSAGNSGRTFRTWSGDTLDAEKYIRIIVPIEAVQHMYAYGPQLIDVNRACADAQSDAARKKREALAAEKREAKLRSLTQEVEEEFSEELDALDVKLMELYGRIEARAAARLAAEEAGEDHRG